MKTAVGIEAIGIALPHRYIEMEELARARQVDPGKYLQGLGARRMAVAEPGEDTVALAATAARRALESSGVDSSRIGMLVVGTETGVDHSKPVASHVQGLLGLHRAMRVYDAQHACYGGTAGLMAAAEWIASGAGAGRVALVICSDIARYGLHSVGEPTQGAGAVAMLVSESPELLRLDVGVSGTSSADVYDFWRPLGQREAQVDGKYSVQCYLDALSGAYRGWKAKAAEAGLLAQGATSEALARVLYHVPFCKMARKAHVQVRRCDLEDARGKPFEPKEEAEPLAASDRSFDAQVASSLRFSEQVGNVYTGSLYLALAGLLDAEAASLAGKRIGLFSYGSGSCSEFFSGVVGERAAEKLKAAGLSTFVERRVRIPVEEYERLMSLPPSAPEAATPEAGTFRFTGVEDHRRKYAAG